MAEESGKSTFGGQNWTLVLPIGALTLLGALILSVSNEAAIGLKLAEQHGESILLLREQISLLRADVKVGTRDRYTSSDAKDDFDVVREDIKEIKELMREAHRAN